MKSARLAIAISIAIAAAPRILAADTPAPPADAAPLTVAAAYSEVPYYLNKLQETPLEGEKMRLNKIIHDAVVTADLSDKKVIKEMDPIVAKVEAAIAAKLDRPYIEGESMWLASAVDFYRRERLKPVIDVPELDWAQPQVAGANGFRISTFPDRILLHADDKTRTATESSNIHEAVIAPNGRKIAYFRETDDGSRAEIWVVDTKSFKRKKIASAKSCLTLLFAPDSRHVLFQEVPASMDAEAPLYSVGAGGRKPKEISRVRLLQTTVEKGKYKGNVVVYKALAHHMGTTIRDCAVVISPSGKEIGRLKNGPCR